MGLTTNGKAWITQKVQDTAPSSNAKMTAIGWGTGTNAEAVGDTALQTEASESRVTGTLSQPTSTTDRLVGTMTATGSKTITEVGRFNSTTVGGSVMQQRHVFTGVALLTNDQIQFTLDVVQT